MSTLIECVPNFSEGRDPRTLDRLCGAVESVSGARLLDRSMDADHNRAVLTFVAPPEAAVEALIRAAAVAVERIDLRVHHGAHPRIGALDVAPFVPLRDIGWDQCIETARKFGQRLWDELQVPVYYYGRAAAAPERERLENVRRGGFEALREISSTDATRRPDVGGPQLHPSAGATAVGVRNFLIAFNVDLQTDDVSVAKRIARKIRESSGGYPAVKALGLSLPSAGLTQVSMNLTDFEKTSVQVVFDRIRQEAEAEGVSVDGSELIGLIPRRALDPPGAEYLRIKNFRPQTILENRLDDSEADNSLGGL